jgi:hypothetical protein
MHVVLVATDLYRGTFKTIADSPKITVQRIFYFLINKRSMVFLLKIMWT